MATVIIIKGFFIPVLHFEGFWQVIRATGRYPSRTLSAAKGRPVKSLSSAGIKSIFKAYQAEILQLQGIPGEKHDTVMKKAAPKSASDKTAFFASHPIESMTYLIGAGLITLACAALLHSEVRAAQAQAELPDMQLWSEQRKARYLEAVHGAEHGEQVLAVLRSPGIGLKVPVYASASELNLDRGAGIIDGMSYPHEPGHIGIAGHRDGYFRAFKDIAIGDRLILDTLDREKHFIVDDIRVIDPDELEYLQETVDTRVTIVTCYPFYYVGSAPQRFIVRARPAEELPRAQERSALTPTHRDHEETKT
jgi:sortase A